MNAGATAPTGMALNVSKRIISLAQAETMGITKAYDTAQSVLCNYHISEFFRRNPNGVLWLRLVAQGLTMTAMLAPANTYTKTLLAEADGKIQMLGVCMNPASFYNPNITNGLDIDVGTAIQNAQQLVVDERDNHRPIHVFIEGRSFTGLAANVLDLRNLTLAAPNVSVVLAQDPDIAAVLPIYAKHAAMGTLLGDYSAAAVHERTDWAEGFKGIATSSRFTKIGLSSGLLNKAYSKIDLDTLIDKGYIFMVNHTGVAGHYWNGAGACVSRSSDYYCVPNNRVVNKAERLIYAAFVPKLNRPLDINTNGNLAPEVISHFESTAAKPLRQMQADREISNFAIYIDPAQNILANSVLTVNVTIQPKGYPEQIVVNIGLTAII
jgi:hypothetical protein